VTKSRLSTLITGRRSGGVDRSWDQFFLCWCPPLQPGVVGLFPGTGCMVLQPFTAGGNQSYPEFFALIGGPRYAGHITPTQLVICTTPNLCPTPVGRPNSGRKT
jgi:hypothetical protein